jgi:hypothetical protein
MTEFYYFSQTILDKFHCIIMTELYYFSQTTLDKFRCIIMTEFYYFSQATLDKFHCIIMTEFYYFFGCVALFRQPITLTAHYSDNPLLRRPIFPTMQNRTQSTNPWFNQVYPTGCSVGQANLDGPWPRQNVLERKRSFYPRLYIDHFC